MIRRDSLVVSILIMLGLALFVGAVGVTFDPLPTPPKTGVR